MADESNSPQPGSAEGGQQQGTQNQGTQSQGPADWTSTISDDYKAMVAVKGWKSPNDALQSYANLEKLAKGDPNTLLRLPGEKADPKEWDAIYNKLGRPEKPEGYKIQFKDGDPAFQKNVIGMMHKYGLNQNQAAGIVAEFDKLNEAAQISHHESIAAKSAEGRASIQKEWGAAYDANMEIARKAVKEFGIGPEIIDALEEKAGYADVMRFFHAIGSKLGEDSYAGGGDQQGFGAMTPAEAKYRISELKMDPAFKEQYLAGNPDALAKMDRLQRFAAGHK